MAGKRGRGRGGGPKRPPGLNFDWLNADEDDGELDFGPTPLFPKVNIEQPDPLSATEQDQVNHFLALRRRIHDGPLYAIIGDMSQIERYATFEAAQFDPFEGLPTYSNIYKKKKRTLPQLNTRSYDSQFFPKELWPTLKIKPKPLLNGSKAGLQVSRKTKGKRKLDEDDEVDGEVARVQAKKPRLDNASDKKGAVENSAGATGRSRVKRVIEDDEDEEDEQEKEEEAKMLHDSDEEEEEEIVDDEFSDEEDGDYNAEQYFDDGSDGYDDGGGDDADGYDDTF